VSLHKFLHIESGVEEAVDLFLACVNHAVIEAFNLHSPRAPVVTLVDDLTDFAYGVARSAAGESGVNVFYAGIEGHSEAKKSAQPVRHCGHFPVYPNGVGD